MLRRRSDKGNLVLFENFRKARIFRQKAIAGMYRIRIGDLAGRHDLRNVQIAFACFGGANAHAFIGQFDMHGVCIRGRMDRHGCNAQLLACAQDSQCDLSAVGNKDFIKHGSVPLPVLQDPRPTR